MLKLRTLEISIKTRSHYGEKEQVLHPIVTATTTENMGIMATGEGGHIVVVTANKNSCCHRHSVDEP